MGAIADAFVAYIQPLIDSSDGFREQLDKAFAIGQACYNLAILPEDVREDALKKLQSVS